jgi:hypothetical protein
MFYSKVQALLASVVGASPLQDVLVIQRQKVGRKNDKQK